MADEQAKPGEQGVGQNEPGESTTPAGPAVQTEQGVPTEQGTLVDILIRIELANGADDGVYDALLAGMQARQWLTTLTTNDGQALPLPYATFSGASADPIEAVADQLHDWIVAEVWADGALVLVTELTGWFVAGEL